MTDTPKRIQGQMRAKDLRLVAPAFVDAREPPLRIGDIVRMNSGGPRMMVVDAVDNEPTITVAYRLVKNGKLTVTEWDLLHRATVHRVRDAW